MYVLSSNNIFHSIFAVFVFKLLLNILVDKSLSHYEENKCNCCQSEKDSQNKNIVELPGWLH